MNGLNKREIQEYFDRAAPDWDKRMVRSNEKICAVLNAAGVREGCRVLDVACGTGVLLEDYLRSKVSRITGVDLSPEMIRIARTKCLDPRVELLCADVQELDCFEAYDCAVVYNAFPHFAHPHKLIASIADYLREDGRICIAHGMSRDALLLHHSGSACAVSLPLPDLVQMAELLKARFIVDVEISDSEKFIIAGRKKPIEPKQDFAKH